MKSVLAKDLLQYKFLSGVKAAPHTDRAAFVVSKANEGDNGYDSSIYLYEKGKTRRLTAMDKERSFLWENDTTLLFPALRSQQDKKRQEAGEIFTAFYRLSIDGGEAEKAFELPLACGLPEPLSDTLYYVTASIDTDCPDYWKLSKKAQEAYRAKKKAGEDYRILTHNPWWFNNAGFVEGQGSRLFTYHKSSGRLTPVSQGEQELFCSCALGGKLYYMAARRKQKSGEYAALYGYDPKTGASSCLYEQEDYAPFTLIPWGGELYMLGLPKDPPYGFNQNPMLYRFDFENKQWVLFFEGDFSFGSSVGSDCMYGGGRSWQVQGDKLYCIATVGNRSLVYVLNKRGQLSCLCDQEGSVSCLDISSTGKAYGVCLYGMKLSELYELKDGKIKQLTHFNDAMLRGRYVAKPNKLTLSSQGWDIDGWVLLPKDYDPEKRYPAILDIHGGPKTVYGEVFFHEMQLWASLGYFVFFCNPVGGDGRGNAFMDIRGKYGTVDYENIMDFTNRVLALYPQIDENRVGVTGGSYGGFMTNWIIGHTDRFACAATQRSISNWISFYGISDIGIGFAKQEQAATLFDNPEKLWFHSPLKYAGQVKTPTLFIHSDEDYRCPISEGLQLYTALVDRGIETRFVWFKGENHELSRSGKPLHRLKRLEEITQWMNKYTKERE